MKKKHSSSYKAASAWMKTAQNYWGNILILRQELSAFSIADGQPFSNKWEKLNRAIAKAQKDFVECHEAFSLLTTVLLNAPADGSAPPTFPPKQNAPQVNVARFEEPTPEPNNSKCG